MRNLCSRMRAAAARYAARSGRAWPGGRSVQSGPIRRRLGLRSRRRRRAECSGGDAARGALAEVSFPTPWRPGRSGRVGCAYYGAAFAELLRMTSGFEGAWCTTLPRRGDDTCAWRAATVEGYDDDVKGLRSGRTPAGLDAAAPTAGSCSTSRLNPVAARCWASGHGNAAVVRLHPREARRRRWRTRSN